MTADQLDQWVLLFRDQYHDELRAEIKKHIKHLTKKAKRKIDKGKYQKLNRLLAELEYLTRCLEHVEDVQWLRSYLKICLEQYFSIEEYLNPNAWEEFFQIHEEGKEDVLLLARDLIVEKLTHNR